MKTFFNVQDIGDLNKALQEAEEVKANRFAYQQLSAEEQTVVDVLSATNDLQVNLLTVKTGIPISRLSALLFTLEMKGVVRSLAGGMYHLLK